MLGQLTGATVAEMEERLDLSRKGVYDLLNFIRDDMLFHIHEETPILGGGKRFSLAREDGVRAGKHPAHGLAFAGSPAILTGREAGT